jgi:3-(3-hydroxy-phenyl)propionate hydroxylase
MPAVVPVGWLAVIRPDKVVMHDGPCTEAAQLLTQAMRLYAGPPREGFAATASARA